MIGRRIIGTGLLLAAILVPVAVPLRGQSAPPVPVRVEATVDASDVGRTARWRLYLVFEPLEDLVDPLVIQVDVLAGRTRYLRREFAPDPPSTRWRKGERVEVEVDVFCPLEREIPAHVEQLDWKLAFIDGRTRRTRYPVDARRRIARCPVPRWSPETILAELDEALARAVARAKEGKPGTAWAELSTLFRLVAQDAPKAKVRDALLEVGRFAPRALTFEEKDIVAKRIADERRRYLQQVAGRLRDRGHLHGALLIINEIGGKLQEQGDAAVIGALADAERVEKDAQDLRREITGRSTPEEREIAQKEFEKLGATKSLLARAESHLAKKRYALAIAAGRNLGVGGKVELARAGTRLATKAEKAWLADVPAEDRAKAEEAMKHPAFDRTTSLASHEFIIIGPERLLAGIPPESRLRFDVAYLYLTDLFGRVPNPQGDRVTVYFKELWDFGGGVGGGKIINIGKANPAARRTRLDTGLLYHELTHCVDDTRPTLAGWREGLANLGAAFVSDVIDAKTDAWHSIQGNLKAFRRDYLERDLEYWRIQNYGPSAGFFLHFLDAYSKKGGDIVWEPYRRFFRAYRASPMKDGREPQVIRAVAFHLMDLFGSAVIDDLIRFRLPLEKSDEEALIREMEAARDGSLRRRSPRLADEFAEFPNSPVSRDVANASLNRIAQRAPKRTLPEPGPLEDVGILTKWWVIGPFKQPGADVAACVFPPEYEIDLEKRYDGRGEIIRWRRPGIDAPVVHEANGWVKMVFSYQRDSAFYGLSHVTVDEPQDVVFRLRTDDDLSLFVNDELVGTYRNRGWQPRRQPLPDAIDLPGRLRPGRNKILLKIRNRNGPAGFVMAITDPTGRPLPDLVDDAEAPGAPDDDAAEEKPTWRKAWAASFAGGAPALRAAVGRFAKKRKRLVSAAKERRVPWRKYTVRPGFPKDAPASLAWLKASKTKGVQDFRLVIDVEAPDNRPKLHVIFQGAGRPEGLDGWSLTLHPSGGKNLQARLERYDRLVYQTAPIPAPAPPEKGKGKSKSKVGPVKLELTLVGTHFSARFGDVTLFEKRPIRAIPDKDRIGIATWDDRTKIAAIRLWKGR